MSYLLHFKCAISVRARETRTGDMAYRGKSLLFLCLAAMLPPVLLSPERAAAESLTLTTYYPAPYGVYQKLRATSAAYLAYQGGEFDGVSIGRPPANPKTGGRTLLGGQTRSEDADFPAYNYILDVNGRAQFRSNIHLSREMVLKDDTGLCVRQESTGNGATECPDKGKQYAAWIPGIWQEGRSDLSLPPLVVKQVGYVTVPTSHKVPGQEDTPPAKLAVEGLEVGYSDESGVAFYCCPREIAPQ